MAVPEIVLDIVPGTSYWMDRRIVAEVAVHKADSEDNILLHPIAGIPFVLVGIPHIAATVADSSPKLELGDLFEENPSSSYPFSLLCRKGPSYR